MYVAITEKEFNANVAQLLKCIFVPTIPKCVTGGDLVLLDIIPLKVKKKKADSRTN